MLAALVRRDEGAHHRPDDVSVRRAVAVFVRRRAGAHRNAVATERHRAGGIDDGGQVHFAHAGRGDERLHVVGPYAGASHHDQVRTRVGDVPCDRDRARGGGRRLAGREHARCTEAPQRIEGAIRIGAEVERAVAGERQWRRRGDEFAHAFFVELAVGAQYAADDAVGAGIAGVADVAQHHGELVRRIEEVTAPRTDHREHRDAHRGAHRVEQSAAGGHAAFAEACTQLEAVRPGRRRDAGASERVDSDLDGDPCIGGSVHAPYGAGMRPQLLHLSGPERGRTVTYEGPVVRIGSDAASDARLTAPGVAPQHARIDWVESECQFHLRRIDGQVFVNGNEVEEVILQDDDQIEFGADGPTARFRIYVPIGAVCKPVRRMLADARDVARMSGGAAATQTLTRDLLTQATPTLKVGVPAVVVASAFLAGWLGGWVGSRPTESERARSADMVTHAELEDLRQEARKQQDQLRSMAEANASVRRIQKEWSRGVCLMHGVFRVRHSDGSWVEQRGRPLEYEYTGSGFLATKDGHVVTNRHVALPWLEVEDLGPLVARGATPEFVHFTATFPGRAPIDVSATTIQRRTDDLDVAVVKLDPAQLDGVPVLPLHHGATDSDDQRAIVVGYPLGLAALLARADPQLVEGLQQRSASLTDAIAELAAASQVSPLITQGIVSDQKDFAIVYDAATTFGGSGGPVFGGTGEVIAVNAAIMQNFGGANLGVPIRFALELLPK